MTESGAHFITPFTTARKSTTLAATAAGANNAE
jgi:hypothetical protein